MTDIPVPDKLLALLKAPFTRQRAIFWKPEKWAVERYFENEPILNNLSEKISREEVATIVADALARGDARSAFIATMVWGYGRMGYGPYRTKSILDGTDDVSPKEVEEKLLKAAQIVSGKGHVEAYKAMLNGTVRVTGLGPAFFTKWLSFSSANGDPYGPNTAPILDKVVRDWFKENTGVTLRYRSTPDYTRYLEILESWGKDYAKTPAQVEAMIFSLARDS